MPRFWSFSTAVFLGIWLTLMLAGRTALFRDPGTFWHVRLGLRTLDTARVTRADTLSFTAAGRDWVDAQWLPECVMAAVYRLCGWDGLLLLAATILAAVYALVAGRLAARGLNAVAVVALSALVLGASSHQFHVRPLLVTIGLLAWVFCRLSDVEAGRRSLRSLVWLVPIFVLWTNCHGGVLAGLGTLGLVVAGWCLHPFFPGISPLHGLRERLAALALVAACATTILVNPYGWKLPQGWIDVLALPLPEMIQEHAPLDWSQPYAWLILLLAAIYLATWLTTAPPRWSATRLMPLVWLLLSIARVRNAPLFAVTALIAVGDVLPENRWAPWLTLRGWLRAVDRLTPARSRVLAALLPLAVVVAVGTLQVAGIAAPLVGRGWVQWDPQRWPIDLLGELRGISAAKGTGPCFRSTFYREKQGDSTEKRTSPRAACVPIPVFNDMLYGGFLIFHAPQLRVFIDDRCELYGKEMLLDYREAEVDRPSRLNDWLAQWHFRYALVQNDSAFDRYLTGQSAWRLVRRGLGAVLYERMKDEGKAEIQKGLGIRD